MAIAFWSVLGVAAPAASAIATDGGGIGAAIGLALVGLAAGPDAIRHLTDAVERLAAGECDVDLETDRSDDVGRLYEAVDGLADALRDCRRGERRFEAVFDDPDRLVAVLAPDGTLRRVNETALEYVDADREDVIGEPFPATPWWETTATTTVGEWIDCAAAGEHVEYEARVDGPGDGRRWVNGAFDPVTNETGDVVSIVVSGRDVTERKARERELERQTSLLDSIFQHVPIYIYAKDEEGRHVRTSPPTIEGPLPGGGPFPTDEEEFLGKTDLELFSEEFASETYADDMRVIEEGEPVIDRVEYSPDFEEWILTSKVPWRDADGEIRGLVGVSQFITDQKERERELRQTRRLLEQSQRLADVGAWEIDVSGPSPEVAATDEVYRIHGLPADAEFDLEDGEEFYRPDDWRRLRTAVDDAIERGEAYDMELQVRTPAGEKRWVRTIGEPVFQAGEVVAVRGAFQNVTEQKERELALESLHEATRGLLGTETETAVAELVVDTAEDVLDVPGVGVYLLDDESNRLEPVAFTPGFLERCEGAPSAADRDGALWNTFVTGNGTVFEEAGPFVEDAPGGLAVPIGDHGVFVMAASPSAIDGGTRRLAETLGATTEAALDRLESEARLRERDAELESHNRRLRRQIRINDIIRRIDQSLIGAASREEIESAVCRRLVEADDVSFAWIGAVDVDGTELVPRAWAGDGEDYLEAISLDVSASEADPAVTVASTEEPAGVANVVEELKRGAWAKCALVHDFHSVVGVPLSIDEYFYGVLAIYGDEPGAFGELERTVFGELGENIANSINAAKTRQALHADAAVELTLQIGESDAFLARIARETGADVEFEGLATESENESRLFFTADGPPVAISAALEDLVAVVDHRLVSESDGRALFEATVVGEVLASQFVRHGGSPRSIRATETGIEAVVDVPATAEVREFVELLRERYPSVELVGRRDVQRGVHPGHRRVASLLAALTDRQREVLRTAYLAGFFEWPRESTGEDVAEMLGVSQPTVNRHLRLGQRRLLERLFDESRSVSGADSSEL